MPANAGRLHVADISLLVGNRNSSWRTDGHTSNGLLYRAIRSGQHGPGNDGKAQIRLANRRYCSPLLYFKADMTASLSATLYTPHFIRTHVFGTDQCVEVRSDMHQDRPSGATEFVAMTTTKGALTRTFNWANRVAANLEAVTASAQNRETIHLSAS